MLSMTNLRALVAVADTGGIRQAAKKLGRTPSAISMALKQIDTALGAPLFEGDRKTHPTRLGRLTIEAARDVIVHYDNTCASIIAHSRHEISRCTIASVTSIAGTLLPAAIQQVKRRSRGFEVVLREVHSARMADTVAEGLADAGISRVGVTRPDVEVEPLFKDPYSLVCAEDHPLAQRGSAVSWAAIAAENLISNESYGEIVLDRLTEVGQTAAFHVSSASAAFAMVRAGVGVTILPKLARMVAPPAVSFLPIADPEAYRTVGIVTRRGRTHSPAVTLLLDATRRLVTEQSGALQIVPTQDGARRATG